MAKSQFSIPLHTLYLSYPTKGCSSMFELIFATSTLTIVFILIVLWLFECIQIHSHTNKSYNSPNLNNPLHKNPFKWYRTKSIAPVGTENGPVDCLSTPSSPHKHSRFLYDEGEYVITSTLFQLKSGRSRKGADKWRGRISFFFSSI